MADAGIKRGSETENQALPGSEPSAPDWFDAEAYVAANPDVLQAIDLGQMGSPFAHFVQHGQDEGRPLFPPGQEPMGRLVRTRVEPSKKVLDRQIEAHVEQVLISARGGIFLVGWIDDRGDPVERLTISGPTWRYSFSDAFLARLHRPDAEQVVGALSPCSLGFFAFANLETKIEGPVSFSVEFRSGLRFANAADLKTVDDQTLRDHVLSYLSQASFLGPRESEPIRAIARGLGAQIISQNRRVTREIVAGAYAETFGDRNRPIKGSLIVCLYGKPEYLFLQSALFSGRPGFEDYEIIYVSNSPELSERLLQEARAAERIYDIPTTLVLLGGNAGFGAANNVAVGYARSRRILIVNPDVFPKDAAWAESHTALVAGLPPDQTRLFGVPLYYDDGSLMHGGMYFAIDNAIAFTDRMITPLPLLRVEHYGKGTPPGLDVFTRPRPVPAVTGAFISTDRDWFEALGGFTEDFVFGHYEDADLCLKSLEAGTPSWLHDIRLWHLEGKGSTRLPVHEGGSIINRHLFGERWGEVVKAGVEGPNPTHPLLTSGTQVLR